MLTQTDFRKLRSEFVTRKEFYKAIEKLMGFFNEAINKSAASLRSELKNDIVGFKDQILGEVVAIRQELTITLGHRGMLEDHEIRITKLEKKKTN